MYIIYKGENLPKHCAIEASNAAFIQYIPNHRYASLAMTQTQINQMMHSFKSLTTQNTLQYTSTKTLYSLSYLFLSHTRANSLLITNAYTTTEFLASSSLCAHTDE